MKRFSLVLLIVIILFGGCSVQKKMSPDIFLERLSKKSDFFIFDETESFVENSNFVCYLKNENNISYVFEFLVNDLGDVKKISLSCDKTEKTENFICNMKDIVSVYSPEENSEELIKNLSEDGNMKEGLNYFENQWYLYCTNVNENGLFFSVTNKKLFPQTSVDFSLKPNDKYDF